MNKSLLAVLLAAVLVIAGAGVAFIVLNNDSAEEKETITVTMSWEKPIVEEIVGDNYKVVSMMGSNVSPHDPYITPSNISDLYKSVVFFKIGTGVEWETAFFDAVSDLIPKSVTIAEIAEGIEYVPLPNTHHHHHDGDDDDDDDEGEEEHEHEHEHESAYDAHIWTSPDILRKVAAYVTDVMCKVDPDHAKDYKANLLSYGLKVDKVDKVMEEVAKVAGHTHMHILVWHPAWQYLINQYAERFGTEMHQEAIESDGEVTPAEAIQIMKDKGFRSVFVSVLDDGYEGRAALEEAGMTVHVVNPTADDMLGSITEFLGFLKSDLQKA